MKSKILTCLGPIESTRGAKTGSAPMDVDALATAASQMQALPAFGALEAKERIKANRRAKAAYVMNDTHGRLMEQFMEE